MFIVYDKRDGEWLGQFASVEDAEQCLGDWKSRGNDGEIVEAKPDYLRD